MLCFSNFSHSSATFIYFQMERKKEKMKKKKVKGDIKVVEVNSVRMIMMQINGLVMGNSES